MPASIPLLRWAARLSALVIAGGIFALIVGEILSPHSHPPSNFSEWRGILLLVATCVGMLLAWRWELPGAVISLSSLIAFTLLIQFNRHTVHMVLAIPGALFLADWLFHRRSARYHRR